MLNYAVYSEVRVILTSLQLISKFTSTCMGIENNAYPYDELRSIVTDMIDVASKAQFEEKPEILDLLSSAPIDQIKFEELRGDAIETLSAHDMKSPRYRKCVCEYLFYYNCFPLISSFYFLKGGMYLPVDLFNAMLDDIPQIDAMYSYGEIESSMISSLRTDFFQYRYDDFLVVSNQIDRKILSISNQFSSYAPGKYIATWLEQGNNIIFQKLI